VEHIQPGKARSDHDNVEGSLLTGIRNGRRDGHQGVSPNLSLVERSILPVAEKRKEKTRRYHAADILCRGTRNLLGRAMT